MKKDELTTNADTEKVASPDAKPLLPAGGSECCYKTLI
jgi:hypothetical protein